MKLNRIGVLLLFFGCIFFAFIGVSLRDRDVNTHIHYTNSFDSHSENHPFHAGDTNYLWLRSFGSPGSNPGEFGEHGLFGIARNASGYTYIADTTNDRIQIYDPSFTFYHEFGVSGDGYDELESPFDIAINSNGTVFITDRGVSAVKVFDCWGNHIRNFGGFGDNTWQFHWIRGIYIDHNDYVYVSDVGNNYIKKYTPTGSFPILIIGGTGTDDGEMYNLNRVVVNSSGYIYAGDDYYISVFDEAGNFIRKWSFSGAAGMDIDPDTGNLLIVSNSNHRVYVYTESGSFLRYFGTLGDGPGFLSSPEAIEVYSGGYALVTERTNVRISHYKEGFDSTGPTFISSLANGSITKSSHIYLEIQDYGTIQNALLYNFDGLNNHLKMGDLEKPSFWLELTFSGDDIYGNHTLNVFIEDVSGNPTHFVLNFCYDILPPCFSIEGMTNHSYIAPGTSLHLTPFDHTNLQNFQYGWFGKADTPVPENHIISIPQGLSMYNLTMNATDAVGLTNSTTFFFHSDVSLPTISLENHNLAFPIPVGSFLDFTISDEHGIRSVIYNWDHHLNSTLISPYDISVNLNNGSHSLNLWIEDNPGNVRFQSYNVSCLNEIPTIQLNNSAMIFYESLPINFSFSIRDGDVNQSRYDIYLNDKLIQSNTWSSSVLNEIQFENLTCGFYNGTIFAYDGFGEAQNLPFSLLIIENLAPYISEIQDYYILNASQLPYTFDFEVHDTSFENFTYTLSFGEKIIQQNALDPPFHIEFNFPGEFSESIREYQIELDDGLGRSTIYTFQVEILNDPPVISNLPSNMILFQEDLAVVLNFTLSDEYFANLTISIQEGLFYLSSQSLTLGPNSVGFNLEHEGNTTLTLVFDDHAGGITTQQIELLLLSKTLDVDPVLEIDEFYEDQLPAEFALLFRDSDPGNYHVQVRLANHTLVDASFTSIQSLILELPDLNPGPYRIEIFIEDDYGRNATYFLDLEILSNSIDDDDVGDDDDGKDDKNNQSTTERMNLPGFSTLFISLFFVLSGIFILTVLKRGKRVHFT